MLVKQRDLGYDFIRCISTITIVLFNYSIQLSKRGTK